MGCVGLKFIKSCISFDCMAVKSKFLQTLSDVLDVSKVVDFRTFVESEEYLGITGVFEWWYEQLNHRVDRTTSRCIFRGSTGSGKSTIMNLVLLYKIYLLFMQGSDFTKTLRLMKGTPVYCLYFSVSMTQARRSGFTQLRGFIDGSKWFSENYPRDKSIDSSIRFPNNFFIEYASGECLMGDSLILSTKGIITAEEVVEGDSVWNGASWSPVLKKFVEEDKEFYRVTTKQGVALVCTEKHKHITSRGVLFTSDLKLGDSLIPVNEVPTLEIPVIEVPLSQNLVCDRNKPKKGFISINEDVAEAFGWFVGDGCYTGNKNRIQFVCSSKEEEVLHKIRSVFSAYVRVGELKKQTNSVSVLNIHAKSLYKVWDELGLTGTASTKRIPECILKSSTKVQSAFLRGLFSSDGCVSIKGSCGISIRLITASEGLALDVSRLLWFLGIYNIKAERKRKGKYSNNRVWEVRLGKPSCLKFNDKVGLLAYKKEILQSYCSSNKSKVHEDRNRSLIITSIEKIGKGTSHGISVDGGVYCSNGIITHNTHQIGLNVWGFILDEANFRKAGSTGEGSTAEFDEVYHLASQLENRLAQRFLRNGVENFFAGYISSASYETAFIQDKGDDYKDVPTAIVLDPVLFKVDPTRYTSNRFEVFFGFGEVSPCVIKDETHKSDVIRSLSTFELTPDKIETLFEKVPLELKKQFDENIYLAIQNICGRPTALRGSFITNYDLIKESYTSQAPSPFSQDSVTVSNKIDLPVQELISVETFGFEDSWKPHSLFMDISLQGDYGSISCVRFDGEFAGVKYHSHVFTLEIIPPAFPAATDLTKVQNFIIWLAQYINIVSFGSDQYQSSQIRQEVVKALDIPDVRVSLDSTDLPHLSWLSACASHRFKMKYYERLDKEIREAVHDIKRRRVVKRKGSSDDQFQSVVGAYFLSDTLGSTTAQVPERVNIVGAGQAQKLMASVGFNSTVAVNPDSFMRRLATEERLQARTRSKFNEMLDSLNDF